MGETNVASTSAEVTAALKPSYFVDSDSPAIFEYAERVCEGALSPREQAVRLYYAVRDGLWYDPYSFGRDRDRFRASNVAGLDRAFCVPKAILLAAAARNRGIPARLGYADVRNHLTSEKLRESMGTDLFVYHGYTELFLDGRWLKATPTFNRELCERFDVTPLEFDGASDALMQEFDGRGRRHMDYAHYHGVFNDFPYEDMVAAWYEAYPAMMAADDHSPKDEAFARTLSDD